MVGVAYRLRSVATSLYIVHSTTHNRSIERDQIRQRRLCPPALLRSPARPPAGQALATNHLSGSVAAAATAAKLPSCCACAARHFKALLLIFGNQVRTDSLSLSCRSADAQSVTYWPTSRSAAAIGEMHALAGVVSHCTATEWQHTNCQLDSGSVSKQKAVLEMQTHLNSPDSNLRLAPHQLR
jgi:hypothetical protein